MNHKQTVRVALFALMLAVGMAWGEPFRDDFNRPDGDPGNGWATQADGTITVDIVDNEILVAGVQGTDWQRSGISRDIVDETRLSLDFKADDSLNFHVRIGDAETSAFFEPYWTPNGSCQYANSEDGSWPGWTALADSAMIAGEYNSLVIELVDADLILTLNGTVIGTFPNNNFSSFGDVLIASDSAAGTDGSLHIDNVEIGNFINEIAQNPSPGSGSTDIRLDPTLTWNPGGAAASHDIYFGTSFDDVNAATRTDPRGVLASEGQPDTVFVPGKVVVDTTYYWRVDEVNSPPDSSIFKGNVWNFTTEPVAYEVTGVSATVSSVNDDTMVAVNTINGSGLNADGTHGTNLNTMWLTDASESYGWITYDLGAVYKLHRAQIWNHNSQTEMVLGYSMKDIVIETSTDGATWTELSALELPRGSGLATYAGTEVSLDGAVAQYVRLTASSNWTAIPSITQVGLSEIRFFYLPVLAREPMPADGGTSDGVDVSLMWRPGREAAQHEVLFSDDRQAVIDGSALVDTVDTASYDAGILDMGTQYFWKINEVNEAETPSVFEGDLWMFSTPEQIMIDDFEMYQAQEGLFIWEHWVDGFDNPAENGAVVGNGDEPETAEVYEGSQSMPLAYNNVTAPKSEATRSFDPPLDLTAGNPEAIEVYVKGIPYEFNGYYSVDGSSWTSMSWNPQYIVMAEDAHVGMAVCSHDVALETTAVYTNVTTTGNVTGDWTQADVGGTHPAGNFTETNGTFTIKAMGADIWTAADEFRYVYKNLDGAGSITAQVQSLDPVNDWTKVGVMIRNTTDVGSSNGGVYATGVNGVRYQARLDTDIAAVSDTDVLDGTQEIMSPPIWVRMERKLANGAAPITMTLTDTSGKSATIESEAADATTIGTWMALSAAPEDLNVNLSRIESITIGVSGAGVEGKIFVDAIRTARPFGTADLLAQYPLDGDTMDASGNGRDGTAVGDPVYIDGAIGQGLEFDGAGGQYVDLGNWDPAGPAEEMSISLWANWNGPSGAWQGLIGKRNAWAADNMMWDVEIHQTNGTLYTHRNGGQTVDMGAFPQGEWTHVGITYDGATAQIYSNGDLAADGAYTFGPTKDAALVFGCCEAGGNNPFNGALDEVRLYGRKLNADEVKELATLP